MSRSSLTSHSIQIATTATEFGVGRALFEEYAAQLGVDLCFQGFAAELDRLPEHYGAPSGALMLAWNGATAAGCVAVRKLEATTCELKRLYVRDDRRGSGLGRALSLAVLDQARALGYTDVVLDTLVTMPAAQALYESLGFTDTVAYYTNPLAGARYLRRVL